MKKASYTIRLSLLCACFVSTTALAYSINQTDFGYTMRWQSLPATYYLNPAGSDNINNGSDIAAIGQSFADWEAVSCSVLNFTKLGEINTAAVQSMGAESNDQNDITFIENNTWTLGEYVLGVTIPLGMTNGQFVEVDIAFNGYHHKWSTTGKKWRVDVKSVAIHEIGHYVGMQHVLGGYSQYNPPTMAPQNDPYGKTASLETDDKLGVCYLYPSGGKFICNNDAECPYVVENEPSTGKEYYGSKLECNSQVCQPPNQSTGPVGKVLGEPCAAGIPCADTLFCQPVADGAYCAQSCSPAAKNCPLGYSCLPYAGGDTGACLPNSAIGGGPNGTPCVSNDDCQSGNCFPNMSAGWECREPCDPDGVDTCPDEMGCLGVPGYATGGCLPDDILAEFKIQDGHPCNEPQDCLSGNCVKSSPSSPSICRPNCADNSDCGSGMVCVALEPSGKACVPEEHVQIDPAPLGEQCDGAMGCESGACLDGVCVEPCVVTDTCEPPVTNPPPPPVQPPSNTVSPSSSSGGGCNTTNSHRNRAFPWIIGLFLVLLCWTRERALDA